MSTSASFVSTTQRRRHAPPCSSQLGHQLLGVELHSFFDHVLERIALDADHTRMRTQISEWLTSVTEVGLYDEHHLESALTLLQELVDSGAEDHELAQSALNLEICLRLHLDPPLSH